MLDKDGIEIPDPTPMALPAGFKVPETMEQMMRRLLRSPEFRKHVDDADVDTFEEAEDFDIGDDMFDPSSPYEEVFDPVLGRGITHDEFLRNKDVYEKRYAEAFDKMVASDALRAYPKPVKREAAEGAAPSSESPKDPLPKGDA